MSDLGRKNIGDKVNEKITPDSEKSGLEKAKETVTGKADSLAADATPENQKSFSQSVADSVKKGSNDAKKNAGDHKETFSETAADYVDKAKTQASNAAEYVSNVVTGAGEGAKKGGK